MGFWIFMFICALLVPAIILAFGYYSVKGGPQEINGVFGYRTKRSMKNRDTWEFAHRYCGKIWIVLGWILLAVSLGSMLLVLEKSKDTVGLVGAIVVSVQTVALLVSIFPVEAALKNTFDDNGHRKQ